MGWSAPEAASFPVNYFTAYLAYWEAGLLEPAPDGHRARVLIHAAAGGVGTAAVQIGKILDVETYGTSSSLPVGCVAFFPPAAGPISIGHLYAGNETPRTEGQDPG